MVQSGMQFCDYERVVCVGANAYVEGLINQYEGLCWLVFIMGIIVGIIGCSFIIKLISTIK